MSAVLSLLGKVPGIVWTVGVLGAAFLYNLYRNQEALLFYPQPPGLQWRRTSDNPSPLDSPARPPWNLAFEDLEVKTSDGVRLHGWFVRAPASVDYTTAPTVLFFHGNAGNIGFRLENIAMLVRSLPANVMIVDYRGYGNSEEVSPTEPGVLLDGLAMADALLARADVDRRKVFYFGRSLGGAVAIATAANARFADSVAGLILENTFTSIGDMVDNVFPILRHFKALVLRLRFPSVDHIRALRQPMLFISGAQDALVPPPMLRALYNAAASSSDKELYVVEDGTHNDTFQKGGPEYMRRLKAFIDRVLKARLGEEARTLPPPAARAAASAAVSEDPADVGGAAATAGGGSEGVRRRRGSRSPSRASADADAGGAGAAAGDAAGAAKEAVAAAGVDRSTVTEAMGAAPQLSSSIFR